MATNPQEGKMLRNIALFMLLVSLVGVYRKLTAPTLSTVPFMTNAGTATALVPVGDELYIALRSKPYASQHMSLREDDFSEIVRVDSADFLLNKTEVIKLAKLDGAIMGATVSGDGTMLYFVLKQGRQGDEKSCFCSLDIKTNIVRKISILPAAPRYLQDFNAQYLLVWEGAFVAVSLDKGENWQQIHHKHKGFSYVAIREGDIYFMVNQYITKISKESILSGSMREEDLFSFPQGTDAGGLFVDANNGVYATIYEREGKMPYLIDVASGEKFPLSKDPIEKEYVLAEMFFRKDTTFYCTLWATDAPLTMDSKILQVAGHAINESQVYSGRPNFLGATGNYLVFNHDRPFAKKSYIFGVKYK